MRASRLKFETFLETSNDGVFGNRIVIAKTFLFGFFITRSSEPSEEETKFLTKVGNFEFCVVDEFIGLIENES